MLSVKSIPASSASITASYYSQLGKEDYYVEGGEPPGSWIGKGAQSLGLEGVVREKQLQNGFSGFHPNTGEPLVNNAGSSHKPGWDCTFSAPKSVSVLWACSDQETREAIQRAQQEGVRAATKYLEQEAIFHRRGHGGIEREPVTGVIAASFEHSASRNGDPQLHTHVLVLNMAPSYDGEIRSVDLDLQHKMVAGAIYRAEFAHHLQKEGWQIQRDGSSFRIVGVPKALEAHWSSRRREVLASAKKHGVVTAKGFEIAALDSRRSKPEIDRGVLFNKWQTEAKEFGFFPENVAGLRKNEYAQSLGKPGAETILQNLTTQASTFTYLQLLHETAKQSQGLMSGQEALSFAKEISSHQACVRLVSDQGQARYTTQEILSIEQKMVDTARQMQKSSHHQADVNAVSAIISQHSLSPEQKRAVQYICGGKSSIACVEGMAGTGKSTMLSAAREVWENHGLEVRGAALAGKAALGLEESAGIKSQTIHGLLGALEAKRENLTQKTVLVVDEAGMVGSRQMAQLIDRVKNAGAKVVLVGDSRQLQPIDAGGAFKAISEEIGKVNLTEIKRQLSGRDKQIVTHFAAQRADEALKIMASQKQLHLSDNAWDLRNSAAKEYIQDRVGGKSSIILAGTRVEVSELNELAREQAKSVGLIEGEDSLFQTSRGIKEFAKGDRVVFLRNDKNLDVKNGMLGKVIDSRENFLRIKTDSGRLVSVHQKSYEHIDHGYALTVHKAQGVTVDRAHVVAGDLTNREWAYVAVSRAREGTHLYIEKAAYPELARDMAKSAQKDTSLDYQLTR